MSSLWWIYFSGLKAFLLCSAPAIPLFSWLFPPPSHLGYFKTPTAPATDGTRDKSVKNETGTLRGCLLKYKATNKHWVNFDMLQHCNKPVKESDLRHQQHDAARFLVLILSIKKTFPKRAGEEERCENILFTLNETGSHLHRTKAGE